MKIKIKTNETKYLAYSDLVDKGQYVCYANDELYGGAVCFVFGKQMAVLSKDNRVLIFPVDSFSDARYYKFLPIKSLEIECKVSV
jgi:hypothetical protein